MLQLTDSSNTRRHKMSDTDTFAVALFSGTDDKLQAAATLSVGAAVMGRPVEIFLQYWALDAFRADRITKDHGVAPEAGPDGAAALSAHQTSHWSELFRQAADVGDVHIHACADSMEMLHITADDLDPLVEGVWGVASFFAAVDGPVTFI
jgi:peroxiredoxin family protein